MDRENIPDISSGLRSWEIESSSSSKVYHVEERIAAQGPTRGSMYLFCPCQGWARAFSNGRDCRHVTTVKQSFGYSNPKPGQADPIVTVKPGDPHANGQCWTPSLMPHTADDHKAMTRLLADPEKPWEYVGSKM